MTKKLILNYGTFSLLFFTIFAFWTYSNTLESPFVFDDEKKIEDNTNIRITQFSLPEIIKAGWKSSKARPIAFVTFALNYFFHQYEPEGYHVVNIIIHSKTIHNHDSIEFS